MRGFCFCPGLKHLLLQFILFIYLSKTHLLREGMFLLFWRQFLITYTKSKYSVLELRVSGNKMKLNNEEVKSFPKLCILFLSLPSIIKGLHSSESVGDSNSSSDLL